MDNPVYLALSRQSGLRKEMDAVANNIANMSTTGYRREGVLFAEMVQALPVEGGSVSMTEARVRRTDFAPGALERTGGALDLALEGDGFFVIAGAGGQRLTRAGVFQRDAEGALTTADGEAVLDVGGAPILLPPEASDIAVARDGAVSVDGQVVGALAVVTVADRSALTRESGVRFRTDAPLIPSDAGVAQGFVEASNVSAVAELTRMIEVQRAYETGQKVLDREDDRVRSVIRTLAQTG